MNRPLDIHTFATRRFSIAPLLAAASLVACLSGCASAPSEHAADAPPTRSPSQPVDWSTAEHRPERLIVVTFETASTRGLARPGASPKGYQGSSRGYRTAPASERTAQQLAKRYDLVAVDDWPIDLLDVHCVVYAAEGSEPIAEVIERLEADPRVKTVQPFHQFEVLGSGSYNDPYLPHQEGLERMQIVSAHDWATGNGVRVGVVDTGVDLAHPDLIRRVVDAQDCVVPGRSGACREVTQSSSAQFSNEAHGTAIAGVIASIAGNGEGIVGVAPGVEVLAYRACWYPASDPAADPDTPMRATCNTFTLAKALDRAIKDAVHILNLSLSGPEDPILCDLLDVALGDGLIIVGAVPTEAQGANGFPACRRGVITVDSARDEAPPKSLRQGDPLRAPGENILTTQPGGKYDFVTGSSFAAAHVTGLAALVLERGKLSSPQLRELLRVTSDESSGVNACDALAALLDRGPCEDLGTIDS